MRHAGFICRGNDGEEVRRVLATGVFRLINVPYTLLNPSAGRLCPDGMKVDRDYGDVIEAARAAGAGAAIYSPLAGGHLTDAFADAAAGHPLARAPRGAEAEIAAAREKARALRFLCTATGLTLAQAAIRFGDGETLYRTFTESRAIRRGIIQAGQDTAAPDFGRQGTKKE